MEGSEPLCLKDLATQSCAQNTSLDDTLSNWHLGTVYFVFNTWPESASRHSLNQAIVILDAGGKHHPHQI